MKSMAFRFLLIMMLFGGILIFSLLTIIQQTSAALPEVTTRYVAPGGNCGGMTPCYAAVQAAVDAAAPGDEIKVAHGTYTDVSARAGIMQAVYISKTVTIGGGYTPTNWTTPDPDAHPTILDAEGKGRVLYIVGNSSPTIKGLRITGGSAAGLGDYWGYDAGSGVYVKYATPTLTDNMIYSNTEAYVGGGVFLWDSSATINNNHIHHNVTAVGGEGGGIYSNGASSSIKNNRITDNTTPAGRGGGVFLSYDVATFIANTLSGNNAGIGGGIYMNESMAQLKRNVVRDNVAAGRGGGIHIEGASPILKNTIVIRNRADLGGCGIDLEGTQAQLLHTTIANNTGGDGSGIRVGNDFSIPGNVTLINTIISGHTIGISAAEHNTATVTSTLWHGNADNWAGAGVINHSDDHNGDPKFAFDGYHLSIGSAAMNKGADAGVTVDIDGDPRPYGSGYDIGADEFNGTVVQGKKLFLPLHLRQR